MVPVDEDVRRRVVATDDRSLCVEAGAGTGKTTLMVERVLHQIRGGVARIDEIVLISFTEKAAAELRARLRDRIEAALAGAEAVEAERLEAALAGLDVAAVQTIHAFAAAILRRWPLEAGLPPGFEALDDLAAQVRYEAAWEEWLADEIVGEPPALREALLLDLGLGRVAEIARRLHEDRAMLPLAWEVLEPLDREQLWAAIQAEATALRALAGDCLDPADRAVAQIEEIGRWAERLRLDASFDRALLSAPAIKSQKIGSKANWRPKETLERVQALFEALAERIATAQAALRGGVLIALVRWLEGFVRAYAEERRRAGVADFDDLLIWTRDLLRDDRAVRRALGERFRRVIVDEFQDTDPLQVEIVAFLCDAGEATRWDEVRLKPGKLCIVGDPMQSIYRFRNADIGVYAAAKRLIAREGGAVEAIVQNFRSVEPLLAWVNRVFGTVIEADAEGETQPAYLPLAAAHPAHDGLARPPLVLLRPAASEGKPSAAGRRRTEAVAVAATIRRAVGEGWPVRAAGRQREVGYGDIAVLFPTTSNLELYEDALGRAGIPYRFEGGRLFYGRQEVRDLTACLAAIDDPTDEIGVVAALTSSAFAIAPEQLFLFHEAGGRFSLLHPVPEGCAEIGAAYALLSALHEARNRRPIGATVEDLLARTRMAALARLRPDGTQAVANLLKVVEQAHLFDGRADASFRSFARWLVANGERTPREVESPISEEGGAAVRMMTVHASKGLEFPVVILANLGSARRSAPTWIADRAAGRIEFRAGDKDSGWRTPAFEAAQSREQAHEEAESRRLLYVACTRASDHLVIPLAAGDGEGYQALLRPLLGYGEGEDEGEGGGEGDRVVGDQWVIGS